MAEGRFFQILAVLLPLLLLGGSILAESQPSFDDGAGISAGDGGAVETEEPTELAESKDVEPASQEQADIQIGSASQELHLDSAGMPRLHLHDGEEVALLSSQSARSLATMADSQFSRSLYDEDYRLQSRLTWVQGEPEAGEDLSLPRPSVQEDYYYHGDGGMRERVVLTDFLAGSRLESYYSVEGLLVREERYTPVQEGDAASEANPAAESPADAAPADPWRDFPELALASVTEFHYDQDGLLSEKVVTHHDHGGDDDPRHPAARPIVQRTLFQTPGDIHGGYELYEDSRLLVSRRYDGDGLCRETRHIDGMRIEATYDGARLVSEAIYLDGRELRRTEY